jgi:LacI family transcriptional regulator
MGDRDRVAARPRRPTIRQLAEHTGLSPAAVSYALRGLQVSPETQARVQAAAEELGFRTDPIARALRGGATQSVGMVVGSLADLYLQELVAGVQRHLRAGGRQLLIADADGDPGLEVELALGLADRRVDALIVSPIGPFAAGWADVARSVPTVSIGEQMPGAATAGQVLFDHERAVRAVLEHLAERGHRRIGVLSWAIERSPARSAEQAVLEWSQRLGLDTQLHPCEYSLNGAQPLARDLLTGPDRPTAIFALSDSVALGVYAACRELGLRIPADVAVVGFDDQPVSRLLDPPLTSVRWHTDRIAEIAVRLAVGATEEAALARTAIVPPALHARGSTG